MSESTETRSAVREEEARVIPDPHGRLATVRERWRGVPLAWRQAVLVTLVLRGALAVASLAFGGVLPGLTPVDVDASLVGGFSGWEAESSSQQGVGLLGASLERFDALWYLAIASDGYPQLTITDNVPQAAAFFPGFPIAIALVSLVLFGHQYLAASLVALAATVAAFAGLHRIIEEEWGDTATARRAVLVAAVFPSAFFLVAPYTESLFLAATIWAIVWARRGRWWYAAPFALAAGITRNVGVLLTIALAAEAWRQYRNEGGAVGWGTLAAVGAAPAGLGAFAIYGWVQWGDLFATVSAQAGWQREFTWPWMALVDAFDFGLTTPGQYATGYHTYDLLVVVPVLAAVGWAVWKLPRTYSLYALAHVLVWLVYPFPDRPLMSAPRFALVVFPIFWAFAVWTARDGVGVAWRGISAALLGVQFLLFVNWYYVF